MSSTALPTPEIAASLRVIAARDESQLQGFGLQWDALAGDVPFRSWTWTQTWWQHYREPRGRLLTLLVFDDQNELVGIAPWYVTQSPGQGRVVRFLGSGEVCSDYLTLLARPELTAAVAKRVGDWLANEGATEWDLLELSGVEEGDPAIRSLALRLNDHGHVVDRGADMRCWRTALANDWEGFLAMLTKSRRTRTKTLLRRTMMADRAVVHRVKNSRDLDRAFEIFIDLHQKRRRSLSQTGCFASKRFGRFHREVAGRLLEEGRLRMLWIELDGRPMSVEYSFVGGDTIFYYQGGFEPEFASESPGWVGLAASLKLAIEEGYRSWDFLRGDESYKTSWRAEPRPLVRVRVVGAQRSARIRFATWRACEGAKHWVRRLVSRTKG